MNELIIKRRWISDLCWTIVFTLCLVLGLCCDSGGKWSFMYIPALIICFLGGFNIIKERHQMIIFDDNGITTPDGTFFDWHNIILIEFRKSWPSLKLYIHTKNKSFVIETLRFSFKFKVLKEYMTKNHPNTLCDSYVIELPGGGGWATRKKREF